MGRDKALIEIEGQPLWRRQLQTLGRLSPNELFLSGPRRDPAVEVIADEVAGAGPLAGVTAALHRSSSPLVLVLALDLPMMTTEFLRSLLHRCNAEQGVVPQHAERYEPLAAVYPKSSAPLAVAALRSSDSSMQGFVRAALQQDLLLVRKIEDDETPLFVNLNTPADLAAL